MYIILSWKSRFSGVYLVLEVFPDTWNSNKENPSVYWNATLSCPLMASNYANLYLVNLAVMPHSSVRSPIISTHAERNTTMDTERARARVSERERERDRFRDRANTKSEREREREADTHQSVRETEVLISFCMLTMPWTF